MSDATSSNKTNGEMTMCKPAMNSFTKKDLINHGGVKDQSSPTSKARMKNMSEIENKKIQMQLKRDHEL